MEKNEKALRRFWTKREEEFLIGAMKDLFASDPKWKLDNGQFKAGFLGEVEKKIILAFPGTDLRASPHIESKVKLWRKQNTLLQDMLRTSGFGWHDEHKMILVDSDDVWNNYVRRVSDVKGMRYKSFPYYEDWLVLFGKDRANGNLAVGPAETVAAMANEEVTDESPVMQFSVADVEGSVNCANPSSSNKPEQSGKKRTRVDGISNGLTDMAEAFGSFIENTNNRMAELAHRIGYAHDLSQQKRQVHAQLQKLPLNNNQRLRAATMIVADAGRVDLFFSLSLDDQMEWVSLLLDGYV